MTVSSTMSMISGTPSSRSLLVPLFSDTAIETCEVSRTRCYRVMCSHTSLESLVLTE